MEPERVSEPAGSGDAVAAARPARRRSMSVTARLLVLVLVPLLGMVAVVGTGLRDRADMSDSSTHVARGVERMQRLVTLRLVLGQERFYANWAAGTRALGRDPKDVASFFGVDSEERQQHFTAEVDRLVA